MQAIESVMEADPVKVFLRLRPSVNGSPSNNFVDLNKSTSKMIVIDKTPYAFDHIFYSTSSQKNIFEIMVSDRIDACEWKVEKIVFPF